VSDELIPDRNKIPATALPPILWAAIALLVAFATLGVYSQSVHEVHRGLSLLSRWEKNSYIDAVIQALVLGIFGTLNWVIPSLSAIVMLWIAFVSPRWSDRMLWSATMIITARELSADAAYFFPLKTGRTIIQPPPH
jgi:hypothetical protein